jgi:NAD(P)-dependent dehydrogenase (short-subunit alcohol dehydrogenase family)
MTNLKGKVVVITGGSSGIGLATAKAFINSGAIVWITGRDIDKLENASKEINNQNLKTVVSDTSTLAGIAILEKSISESGNKLDILFLNAGIATFLPIALVTETDFDAQFNTNVKGAYFTLQQLLPHLADGASIVFCSSINATSSSLGSSVYSATKGALNKIAKIAANELAERKIRVNIVSPGPTDTPGLDNAVPAEAKGYMASFTAVKRLGDSDDIAKTVLFLASDDASFITGTEIIVDGGLLNYALK